MTTHNELIELVKLMPQDGGRTIRISDYTISDKLRRLVPEWYWALLDAAPLASRVDVVGDHDHIVWLTPELMDMLLESPGSDVVTLGYVPIGDCAFGSGDPYYVRFMPTDTSPIVQIYHDSGLLPQLSATELPLESYRIVASSIRDILTKIIRYNS